MRSIKSERLKKLETELNDLQQWLKLGLVPKKDIDKHNEEIDAVKGKIEEEKRRLQFLKESGDVEEYVAPKRAGGRGAYTDMPTIPDLDVGESATGVGESRFDFGNDTEGLENESSVISERDENEPTEVVEDDEEVDEESYFSDRNRWRRGGIVDPDANEW